MRCRPSLRRWLVSLFLGLWSGAVVGQDDPSRGVDIVVLPQEVRFAAQSAGLFIGISEFEDKAFAEVPYAVDDAVDLVHLFALELKLIAPGNVQLGLSGPPKKRGSRSRLQALLDAGASQSSAEQSDVYRLLGELGSRSGSQGFFVVALATHGFSDQGSDYLVASDSLRRRITRTGVALNEVFEDVAKSKAGRRLVLVDACRERLFPSRGSGDPDSAMSRSFATAIAKASGQVVFSGTTEGGYSYDDPERGNGVFTAAVLDGLRGQAPADDRSFITVRRLADYVDRRVVEWVRRHRPEHSRLSRGIGLRLEEVSVADMPLAVNPRAREKQREIETALDRLRQNIGGPVSGAMYDEIAEALSSPEVRQDLRRALLAEIMALDGGERLQRSLRDWFNEHLESMKSTSADDVWTEPVLGMRFRNVPSGTFQMGSPDDEQGRFDGEKSHKVNLTRGFWMGETEVTQGQWRQLMKNNPSRFQDCGDDCPVERVSWWDAVTFANRLSEQASLESCYEIDCQGTPGQGGYSCQSVTFRGLDCEGFRLPTEAEWERSARAGSQQATYGGDLTLRGDCDAPELASIAWYGGNSDKKTHPVGRLQANEWGLHDMLGNVWEWVWDSYSAYTRDVEDPLNDRGRYHVIRGGGWDGRPRDCRAARRARYAPRDPRVRDQDVGLQLVRISD